MSKTYRALNPKKMPSADIPRKMRRTFCPGCKKFVDLKTFGEVADFYDCSVEEILALAKFGRLHQLHNRKAELMICAESFFELLEQLPTQELTP